MRKKVLHFCTKCVIIQSAIRKVKNMTTGERIKKRRKELDISVDILAEKIGVDRSTIYRYERGDIEKVPISVLEPVAKALHTTVSFLMGWNDSPSRSPLPTAEEFEKYGLRPITKKRVPLLGNIPCGEPKYADEDIECYVEIGNDVKADFCLRAKGDSMIGARIHDGDLVFIRSTPQVDNGQIAAVIIDDEATLKRVYYYPENNMMILKPENSKYKDLIYLGDQLETVRILGLAVGLWTETF